MTNYIFNIRNNCQLCDANVIEGKVIQADSKNLGYNK